MQTIETRHPQPRKHWSQKLFNTLISWTLFPLGDLCAQLITQEFNPYRLLALSLAGGLIYQYETTAWFELLENKCFSPQELWVFPFLKPAVRETTESIYQLNGVGKTMGAILYFNPIWIARHMLFITLGTTPCSSLNGAIVLSSLLSGSKSFLVNLPLSLLANYILQEKIPYRYRYLGSIVLTGLFAIAYALHYQYFH
jgi:hypothetical protein